MPSKSIPKYTINITGSHLVTFVLNVLKSSFGTQPRMMYISMPEPSKLADRCYCEHLGFEETVSR